MRLACVLAFVLTVTACKQKSADEQTSTSNDSIPFFQLAEYINEQVAEVKKTPFFIYQKNTIGGRTDSFPINSNQFAAMAQAFVQADINTPTIKSSYTENPFLDQTTKTYTLNYTAKDKTLPVQSIDILLQEDARTLKRIFIRKFYNYNDSTAIEQLSWKPNQSFEINRMVQEANGNELVRQTTVVWNDKP